MQPSLTINPETLLRHDQTDSDKREGEREVGGMEGREGVREGVREGEGSGTEREEGGGRDGVHETAQTSNPGLCID